jgi:hypothetical protein
MEVPMPKIILAMFATLEGFVEAPDGKMIGPAWSGDLERCWREANTAGDITLLYGRRAFEQNAHLDSSGAGRKEYLRFPRHGGQDESAAKGGNFKFVADCRMEQLDRAGDALKDHRRTQDGVA